MYGYIYRIAYLRRTLEVSVICFKTKSFLSLPFFLQKIFKFDGLCTELMQTSWLKIVMLLFLFIAGRSVQMKY